MRSRLVRLLEGLADLLVPHPTVQPANSPAALGHTLERLEERASPSSLQAGGAIPTGCTCPFCTGGAAYVLGGGVAGNSPNAVKWAQPGGLGAPVTITYSYSNLLDGRLGGGLPVATIKAAIQEAMSRWAAVAPLRFVEVRDSGPAVSTAEYDPTGKPMIRIGHRYLDGDYGTLGYGYYPGGTGLSGDIHLDDGESWTVNPALGLDLTEVATHELGHALGLAHSQAAQSVMRAMYGGYFHGPGTSFLFADDIAGIRALYGAGVGSVKPLGPTLAPGQTFTVIGNTLYVQGTAGNDSLALDASAGKVAVNNVNFAGNLGSIRAISINLGAGNDSASVTGSSGAETFTFRPGQMTLAGSVWNVALANCEQMDVTGGSGDTATMTGSAGNDSFVATPAYSQFRGPGFNQTVRGFSSVSANAVTGVDTAQMYDSAGNDTWTANPRVARMEGDGYANRAEGFDAVYAYSSGGTDTAKLYDSAGNDLFVCGPSSATLKNVVNSYLLVGSNFDVVQAYSTVGIDTATLYDTSGKDNLIGTPAFTSLSGDAFRVEVSNFERVFAVSRFGLDEAYLYDSAGNDYVTNTGSTTTLYYPATLVQFTNFAYAALYGTTGGINHKPPTALPYVVDWYGTWQ